MVTSTRTTLGTLLSIMLVAWLNSPLYAQAPQILVNSGHSQKVTCMDFHPSGKWLATGSLDRTVRIWDVDEGRLIKIIPDGNQVTALSFVDRGDTLLIGTRGDYDGITAVVIDAITEDTIRTFTEPAGFKHLQYSPENKMILSQHEDGSLRLWDVTPTVQSYHHQSPEAGYVESIMTFSQDLRKMVVVLKDSLGYSYFSILDIDSSGNVSTPSPRPLNEVPNSVFFTPDGQYAILETFNPNGYNTYSFYDVKENDFTWTITAHSMCIDPERKVLLYHHSSGVIGAWSWVQDTLIKTSSQEYYYPITALAFSPERNQLAGATSRGDLIFWNATTLDEMQLIETVTGVNTLDVNGKDRLTFNGVGGDVHHLNMNTGTVKSIYLHDGYVTRIAYSESGSHMLTAGVDSVIRCWSTVSDTAMTWAYILPENEFVHVAFTGDDSTALINTLHWQYQIDVQTGNILVEQEYDLLLGPMRVSSNGEYRIATVENALAVYYPERDSTITISVDANISALELESNEEFIWFGTEIDSLYRYRLTDLHKLQALYTYNYPTVAITLSADGRFIATGHEFGLVMIWDLEGDSLYHYYTEHTDKVTNLLFKDDGYTLLSSSSDGRIVFYEVLERRLICELFVFPNGEWAVVDASGRFDADPSIMDRLHMVVGTEIIDLAQIKHRYYEPGILPKLLGYEDEPIRSVDPLDDLPLAPNFRSFYLDGDHLYFSLEERNGGQGPIEVYINNMQLINDCKAYLTESTSGVSSYQIPLDPFVGYTRTDEANVIRVRSYNKDAWLFNRSDTLHWNPTSYSGGVESGNIYILSIGIQDYRGDQIDLTYTSQDANMMATALEYGAKELAIHAGQVHLNVLTTDSGSTYPSRENIIAALEWLQNAQANDIVIIFYSGHGVSIQDEFYLMTAEASTLDPMQLSDLASLRSISISSAELSEALNNVFSNKKVVILDACASGRGASNISTSLLASKAVIAPSTQRSWERINDRSGSFILAGSAGDAESFESNAYGQSLLTYALLRGMRGEATRKDSGEEYVDILTWFGYTREQVMLLAEGIGNIQEPKIFPVGAAESFDIARVDRIKDKIPINQAKPVIGPAQFTYMQENGFPGDDTEALDLSVSFNAMLDDYVLSSKGRAPFVFTRAEDFPGSVKLVGTYTLAGEIARMNLLIKSKKGSSNFQLELDTSDKETMLNDLVNACLQKL